MPGTRALLLCQLNRHSLALPVCIHTFTIAQHLWLLIVAVELSRHVPYSAVMAPKSLLQHNPHLRNAQEYQRALHASVLSSIAIEGVKKAAERALTPTRNKQHAKAR